MAPAEWVRHAEMLGSRRPTATAAIAIFKQSTGQLRHGPERYLAGTLKQGRTGNLNTAAKVYGLAKELAAANTPSAG